MHGGPDITAGIPRLVVTDHAAVRWADRVRGDAQLPGRDAERDLLRCARAGELAEHPPEWLVVEDGDYPSSKYLMLGDDVAIIVLPSPRGHTWMAATVVTREDNGSVYVAARRAKRHERLMRQRQSTPRRMRSELGRRDVRPFDDLDD